MAKKKTQETVTPKVERDKIEINYFNVVIIASLISAIIGIGGILYKFAYQQAKSDEKINYISSGVSNQTKMVKAVTDSVFELEKNTESVEKTMELLREDIGKLDDKITNLYMYFIKTNDRMEKNLKKIE